MPRLVLPRHGFFFVLLLAGAIFSAPAQAVLKAEQVPLYALRMRVQGINGAAPAADRKFTFQFLRKRYTTLGSEWTDWLDFTGEDARLYVSHWPATLMPGFPVVGNVALAKAEAVTRVEVELRFNETGGVAPLHGDVFGAGRLGYLLWRDEKGQPRAATDREYNQQKYWSLLDGVDVPESERPQHIVFADRFIGDSDLENWRAGLNALSRAGFNVLSLPNRGGAANLAPLRPLLSETGIKRTADSRYTPAGGYQPYEKDRNGNPAMTPEKIAAWAEGQVKPYLDVGFAREDVAFYGFADEPGWYYPPPIFEDAAAQRDFREYLKAQNLAPADVGATSWENVKPIGRGTAANNPTRANKVLYYWSTRFVSWSAVQHFANVTRALEKTFYPNLPIYANWNNFSGRLFVPGPAGGNPNGQSPDAGAGSFDWQEYARLRGATMLWTEDWFGDEMAWQWSFYMAKLAPLARKYHLTTGAYIIPRTTGSRADGLMQKVLEIVGNSGKVINYFTFGPEYTFPSNCYSERAADVLPKMAAVHRMVGKAEDVLWPGVRPQAEVAILHPRSSEMWDSNGIADGTQNLLYRTTTDYFMEVFGWYLGLQHANIPADFVEEDDLSPQGLKGYKVLFVSEPDVPAENVQGLLDWVRAGGTLITVTGAAAYDRYHERSTLLADATGLQEAPRPRVTAANFWKEPQAGAGQGEFGAFTAYAAKGEVLSHRGAVRATFDDGKPAVVSTPLGRGHVVHYAWLPGLSYYRSGQTHAGGLTVGYSDALSRWITFPLREAGVAVPVVVDHKMVETPLLLSSAGVAVTLLNWSGAPIENLKVMARVPFAVKSVESALRGQLDFKVTPDGVEFTLPLDGGDIVKLKP